MGSSARASESVVRYLLETLDQTAIEHQLFKIVEDLNRSRELIESPAERLNSFASTFAPAKRRSLLPRSSQPWSCSSLQPPCYPTARSSKRPSFL
jgi:hypothetical protein